MNEVNKLLLGFWGRVCIHVLFSPLIHSKHLMEKPASSVSPYKRQYDRRPRLMLSKFCLTSELQS